MLEKWENLYIKTVPYSVLYNAGTYVITCGSCNYFWRRTVSKDNVLPISCPYCNSLNIMGHMEGTNVLEE